MYNHDDERASTEVPPPALPPRGGSAPQLFLGSGLALALATAAFFSGFHLGNQQAPVEGMEASLFSFFRDRTAPVAEADLTEFWRVWHLMDEKFAYGSSSKRLTTEEKVEGAISGLVERYNDPYTIFLPPSDASAFEQDISGNFGGVGMEVGIRDGLVTVIAPLPDTPAANAGIIAGDVILEIDGASTDGMSVDEAVKRIRGEEGTVVNLTLFRQGATEAIEKSVTRGIITIPTVETEVVGDVFVIRLYSFNALAEARMQEALREYVRSGQRKLLLDLRGNPGGYLQSAVSIASYFLPAGKVIVRESFGEGQPEEVYRSQGRTLRDASPERMVVLVNQGSASASEILAGALRAHDVATLIGEPTFGKGSVQELVSLPSGSSLKVTIARWLTPEGINISENGLTPDIEVERSVEQILAGDDPQQAAAIEYLAN